MCLIKVGSMRKEVLLLKRRKGVWVSATFSNPCHSVHLMDWQILYL